MDAEEWVFSEFYDFYDYHEKQQRRRTELQRRERALKDTVRIESERRDAVPIKVYVLPATEPEGLGK